ncbi:PPC domain-containing protein [Pseudoalteromonas phenolica]|uniref:PPC domain-containing protein n=1 Tax=Pseudoalteromonas phenolica TaxID=161398 RepID=UPI001F0E29FE|nr:PPC domain-containing protein [Pseudoalteromonas phenolica]
MNNWLQQDLQSSGGSASWRVAQYHKPMFPHYSGKSDNTILHSWWANHFYNHKMNLVVESDTHINKVTQALKPSGNNFTSTTSGGTVFVGEGSWGAPARSANDPKSWTIDLASIQQFKVLTVSNDKLDVRTAQFNSTANTLSKADRDANPTLLPNNVNWWNASGAGDVLNLVKATNGLTKIDTGVIDPPVGDKELTSGVAVTNISGSKSQELGFYIDVPAGQSALLVEMSGGTGDADIYVRYGSKPTSSTYDCRPYKNGNNETCSIDAVKTGKYYVVVKGYSAFSGVSLKATYNNNGGGGNGGSDTFTNLSASTDKWQYRSATLPSGISKMTVTITDGTGDADLYVKSGSAPNSSSYECRPYKDGNSETCTLTKPKAGEWHFGVKAYKAYSGVTLSYSYE